MASSFKDIHPLLKKRWSPKAFSEKKLTQEQIKVLFEAARWAPSSYNEQPWRFIIATKEDDHYEKLLNCLNERNESWAEKAPLIGVSLAKMYFERNGKRNRHNLHDVGLAMSDLVIQATSMDLYVHTLAGYFPDRVHSLFSVPDSFEPVAMFVVGYMGDARELPEGMEEKDPGTRTRIELHDLVYGSSFGAPSDHVK